MDGPFNIATGEPHSIWDMASALCDAFGEHVRPRITGAYRLGDVRHVFASPERARRILGFEARVPFAEGMREFATAPLRAPASAVERLP
jgi:dTDP-L-rhamnose 4-epimerase